MTAVALSEALHPEAVLQRCQADGELQLAVRHWSGGLRFEIGSSTVGLTVDDGEIIAGVPETGPSVIELGGDAEVWEPMLAEVPPPLAKTVATMVHRGLEVRADPVLWWQYLPATERFIELLRGANDVATPPLPHAPSPGDHDAPTGRYVHLMIAGHQHRVYYEEAGDGIPLLLQHTAGAHGVQWRHVFECNEITDRFRVIAYDLPFHGKSLPPTSLAWWRDEYRLSADTLRSVPVAFADALELHDPVFMGCSVGGLLALDLALHHADRFRAVIAVEGALHVSGDRASLIGLDHPAVSGMAKARMMEGLCSPTSPTAYVKEIAHVYAAGWPPAFRGDLAYYLDEFDLTERAGEIDTAECAVHILNGTYDYSGSVARGREAHEAIPGSTHQVLAGVGHFPMTENPARFLAEVMPVLDSIAR